MFIWGRVSLLCAHSGLCTCQGQELGRATSPPTTLSSTLSSSKYLGSGVSSASTKHSGKANKKEDELRLQIVTCVRLDARGGRRTSHPGLRARSRQESGACLLLLRRFSLDVVRPLFSYTPVNVCVCRWRWRCMCVHLCLSHSYHCHGKFIHGAADCLSEHALNWCVKHGGKRYYCTVLPLFYLYIHIPWTMQKKIVVTSKSRGTPAS